MNRHYKAAIAGDGISLLRDIARGIEKEGLRVQRDSGILAQTPHPTDLGSALTHDCITTDYSESLLEFITPVTHSIEGALKDLETIHRFTANKLNGEVIWGASMPCIVAGEKSIPIANYGSSNVGTMKRVYRNGLGVRYGRMMQAIAGIHYNFSLPEAFWKKSWESAGKEGELKDFKTTGYLRIIRNFFERVWLLVYLRGSSPSVCASFLAGHKDHPLEPFDDNETSLYLPYATSLRMGDLGYNSNAQSGLSVCYNSLCNYVRTLHKAITEEHPAYADFEVTDEGEQAQLSTALLQIENEFYSPIRPKRVTKSGEAPLNALERAGIEYIEVRCLDINPFLPLGIDADTIRLVDAFLVACLIADSPLCDEEQRERNSENLRRVVNTGRDPELTLLTPRGEMPFQTVAAYYMEDLLAAATLLDEAHGGNEYETTVRSAMALIEDPELTPSARVIAAMKESGGAFWRVALKNSCIWDQHFRDNPLDDETQAKFEQMARDSLEKQSAIEAADDISFEEYLARFYAQYEELSE